MSSTVLVLGSGPIRIGQGIEFDYSCVHCVWALRHMGYRAVIVNNNPETVSTDFDTGDGLYFEPVTLEDVLDVVKHESPIGVICQFGGQTAINLADKLESNGVKVLGTAPTAIAAAEDRAQFDDLLARLNINRPPGKAVTSFKQAEEIARSIGYPVLVRPSFVLGGRAMEIVFSEQQLENFYQEAEDANPGQPILIDKYLLGTEAEVDVISDGIDTFVPGIMEHVERAGVHSGDSIAVYPPVSLSHEVQAEMVHCAQLIAKELNVRGLMNIQFVVQNSKVYVLEVNPRASRTIPYLSKVTGVPMVDIATRCTMGQSLKDLGYGSGLWILTGGVADNRESFQSFARGKVIPVKDGIAPQNEISLYAVKAPVFSFLKLGRVEPSLGPEMKSTGEVLGIDRTYEGALYKALIASHVQFKGDGLVLLSVKDADKDACIAIGRQLQKSGRPLVATPGTAELLIKNGIECAMVNKIQMGTPNILELIMSGNVSLMVNTPSLTETSESEAARIRRACIETGIPCITNLETAAALIRALSVYDDPSKASCLPLKDYFSQF